MKGLRFVKMHGLGNDFLVTDSFRQRVELSAGDIARLADRHTGVGFDQLLLLEPDPASDVDARYRIFNADGSAAGHCGNGARCAGVYLRRQGLVERDRMVLQLQQGRIELRVEDGTVSVNMGRPDFRPRSLPVACDGDMLHCPLLPEAPPAGLVSVGNPHAVLAVDDVAQAPVAQWGPAIQALPRFPQGVNVGFMQRCSDGLIRLRVYERGAGETRACGTGACAAVAVGRRRGLLGERVRVQLPGGELTIHWPGPEQDLWMSGPAAWVYEGRLP